MKVSGFTIIRNTRKFGYPLAESIQSILPICDEFIINVGDSEDDTLDFVRSIRDKKIRIIENAWDMSLGKEVLSRQTNIALEACRGDWAFYLQADEVIHEKDLPRLRRLMLKYQNAPDVDALRLSWLHFYGSYYRYRTDAGWYQKQDRIIKNNGQVISFGDAYGFQRRDGKNLRRVKTGCPLYHYGWVNPPELMRKRVANAGEIGYADPEKDSAQAGGGYDYGDLSRFPLYLGSHPHVMRKHIAAHAPSRKDAVRIRGKYWWHPARVLDIRRKTILKAKG